MRPKREKVKYKFPRKKFFLEPWMRQIIFEYKEAGGESLIEIADRIGVSYLQLARPLYRMTGCSRESFLSISEFATMIRDGNYE